MTPPIEVEEVTTPDIPSSSPGLDGLEAMDISPLPHKAPYFQVTLPSPTPEATPEAEELTVQDLLSPDGQPIAHALPSLPPPSFLHFPEYGHCDVFSTAR